MPNEGSNKSLLQTILNMVDTIAHEGSSYDTLINVLSLLCLLSILNRLQPPTLSPISQTPQSSTAVTNPLQKIIGDLTKTLDGSGGGGGPSPDMLMSLLPLLNNPQIKSKLNPANISNILGLMNNLGGGGSSDKAESPKSEKNEKTDKSEKKEKKDPPPMATTSPLTEQPVQVNNTDSTDPNQKDLGRSLNWKTNFQNEKEV